LLKRIAFYLLGLLGVAFLLLAYPLYRENQVRTEHKRKANQLLSQMFAEQNALASLGDIDINPAGLTLAGLNEVLQQPARKVSDARNRTRLGWACGGDNCAIWASFLIERDREILPSATPAVIVVTDFRLSDPHRISIGGVLLGEPAKNLLKLCQQRGYAPDEGKKMVSWDKDWKIVWTESDGRVSGLIFLNMKLTGRAEPAFSPQ
jgi:hypothetical protein